MWDSALQASRQPVTDGLLHRAVLPNEALAFERVSGAIAVRTALRLLVGEQTLIFAVPEVAASTARHVAAALLIGNHAHTHGAGQVPDIENRHLLKGDVLIITQAIAESKARLDELDIGRGQRLSDIWEVMSLTRYTSSKATKPRVFLANPGWMAKIASGRRFGAVVIDASHPRTYEQLAPLLRSASGCSSLRIAVAPPPSESTLTACCGAPSKTSVWLWDPNARQDAQTAVERQDPVPHVVGDRFLWVCDSDIEAANALAALYKRLTEAARAANGKHYPGLRECWAIYNRLRQVAVPLAELEQVAATTWAGNIRARVKDLDCVSGHGLVAWDTTWPELLAATKHAYETLLKRKESAKFWGLASNLEAFLTSPSPHLRIVVGSEAEVTLLIPTLELVIDGLSEALTAGRVEFVTGGKEARLIAEGQVSPTVLLAPRTNGHRYLDVFSSKRVDEFLYPHEVDAERSTQARLHAPWEPLQADERRVRLLEPLGFTPLSTAKPRPSRGRPSVIVRRADGHTVTMVNEAEVSHEIDIDALATVGDRDLFNGGEPNVYSSSGGAGSVTDVRFADGESRHYYGNERVDVFFSESSLLERHPAHELQPGWRVVTFVDGQYDSLFHRLAEVVSARLPPKQRVALELWKTSKEQLMAQYSSRRELHSKLASKGLTSGYATFISWFGDSEDGVIAPQQFDEFKVLASEIELYANSKSMLDTAFKAVQNERGRNRVTGKTLRRFLRAVVSGDGYEEAMASARKLDAAMADVFAAVEVLEVVSVHQVQRSIHA